MLTARRLRLPPHPKLAGGGKWPGNIAHNKIGTDVLSRTINSLKHYPAVSSGVKVTASHPGTPLGHLSLARSSIGSSTAPRRACFWTHSGTARGLMRESRLRMTASTAATAATSSRAAGLSTSAIAAGSKLGTAGVVEPLWKQVGLRVAAASRRARGVVAGKRGGGGGGAGGNIGRKSSRGFSSFSGGGGSGDTVVLYGLVGLNVLGTIACLPYYERLNTYLFANILKVSTASTLWQGNSLSIFTANFTHGNLWNGALCSYMVYNMGSVAMEQLGRRQFLALYLVGGAFSQLCQVAGPTVAKTLGLPSILEVDPYYPTTGGMGALLAVLSWYCITFPSSQVLLMVVPVRTGSAGALFLFSALCPLFLDGVSIPFLGGPPQEIWRTLGAIAAGAVFALASGRRGRYQFIKRY